MEPVMSPLEWVLVGCAIALLIGTIWMLRADL